jgi:hypothetical protein
VKGSIKGELPVGNAVGVSSYRAAKVRIVLQPPIFVIETHQNIFHPTLTIRNTKAPQGGTERIDVGLYSRRVTQDDGFQ